MQLCEKGPDILGCTGLDVGAKTQGVLGDTALDDLVQTDKGATTNEQDICCIDAKIFLLWMLSPSLRRDVCRGPLDYLEKSLLDTLSGNVAGDRDVLALAGYLVDLVDVDDSAFCGANVATGILYEFEQDVLDMPQMLMETVLLQKINM